MTKDCKKSHRYLPFFESFPFDQGGFGRHISAGCAYEKGFKDGALKYFRCLCDERCQ